MSCMRNYVFVILALVLYSPANYAAMSDYFKGTFVAISYAKVDYEMKANSGGGSAKTQGGIKRLIIGKRLNSWASMEFQTLYSSSVDQFDNPRAVLGRDFAMEINRFNSFNFKGIAYHYKQYDVHGVIGLSRIKYLDQDAAVAQGRGINYGIGAGVRFSPRMYLQLGWEILPRIDYDENIFGAPLDPMHIEANQLLLQFDVGIK